jgi:hypothetical protein
MSTQYPNAIDSTSDLSAVVGLVNFNPDWLKLVRDAVIAIETELGINPSGTFSTVVSRLDSSLPNPTINQILVGTSSTTTTWAQIVDGYVSASAAIAGTKISPNFGSQNVITTGDGYFNDGYFTTCLSVGTNPALSGVIRIPNNTVISARNVSNTADLQIANLDTSNNLFFGNSSTLNAVVIGNASIANGLYLTNGGTINFTTQGYLHILTADKFLVSSLASNFIFQITDSTIATLAAPLSVKAQSTTASLSTGGNLFLTSGSGTSANGALGLQTGGSNRLIISDGYLTIQSGVLLTTTSNGNINLPNNGGSKFQIENVSIGSTVTAANLDTLTNGSNADSLHTHAGIAATITSIKTGTYTAAIGEIVRCDPSSSGFTINLPTAVGNSGKEIAIKNTTSSTNTITVDASGSETIDDSLTYLISVAYQSITLVSNGSNWMVI